MGCCSISRKIEIVNDVFFQLPIRNVSIKKFLNNFDLKQGITSTKFQVIINDYLLLQDKAFASQSSILFDYWFNFHNNLASETRSIHLCFILGLLCKNLLEEDVAILAKILTSSDSINKEKTKEMIYSKTEFKTIIETYIRMLTIDTIDYFKYFSMNPTEYEQELQSEWEVNAIDTFVEEMFHISNKKEESANHYINIKVFLKEHLDTLKNDQLIRNEFTIYSKKYREKNKRGLDLNQLRIETYNA